MFTTPRFRFGASLALGLFLASIAPVSAQDGLEPNDGMGSATPVTLPNSNAGLSIHDATDEDFFSFPTPPFATVEVSLTFNHAAGDLDLELQDVAGNPLATATSVDDNELLRYWVGPGLASPNLFVRVYGYSGATNSYDINITLDTEVRNLTGHAGVGTLLSAIEGANVLSTNQAANVDVTFAPGLFGTISWVSDNPTIRGKVSIVGPGRDFLAVSGANVSRVFEIASSELSPTYFRDSRIWHRINPTSG